MTAAAQPLIGLRGSSLEPRDLTALAERAIGADVAALAHLRRVDSVEGGEILGRNGSGRYEGIAIPYIDPGSMRVREYRIRRDHPEFENGKPRQKYIAPPGRGNLLYWPPGTDSDSLQDPTQQLLLTEGEFKALALFQAAQHELGDAAERPRFIVAALSGVWNWRGTIGKTTDESGTRVDEKGVIPDFDRISFRGRRVTIVFDRDLETNDSVTAARTQLTRELQRRGALVRWFSWPPEAPEAKGIDDLIASVGPERVLDLIGRSIDPNAQKKAEPTIRSIAEVEPLRTYASRKIDFVVSDLIAEATLTLVTGEAGSGKTTLTTAIGCCVSRGIPFAGRGTRRRPVVMFDRENPLPVVVERFGRLGFEDGDNLKVWGGWLADEPPAPNSPIITEYVAASDPKPLLIFDTLISYIDGDENNAVEMRACMQAFRRLTEMGATVIVLHHSGKGETSRDYRGSSDIKAAIDVGFHLANLGEPSRLDVLRLRAFKARFTVDTEVVFRYSEGTFSADSRSAPTVEELLIALLQKNPGIRAADFQALAMEKDLGRDRARQFLERHSLSGNIRQDRGAKNARFHTWLGGREDA
jgi:hypothetical protein